MDRLRKQLHLPAGGPLADWHRLSAPGAPFSAFTTDLPCLLAGPSAQNPNMSSAHCWVYPRRSCWTLTASTPSASRRLGACCSLVQLNGCCGPRAVTRCWFPDGRRCVASMLSRALLALDRASQTSGNLVRLPRSLSQAAERTARIGLYPHGQSCSKLQLSSQRLEAGWCSCRLRFGS